MCEHFGDHTDQEELVQMRINGEAPEGLVEPCHHPENEPLNLKVAPNSGCTGFTPAMSA